MACLERDVKKLVAISTLRQIGFLMFFLALGHVDLGFFHIVCHALFKSLIFLSCGFFILVSLGNQDMRFLGRKGVFRKVLFLILVVSLLRLCGFPFLTGFFSKDLLVDYLFNQETSFFILIVFLICCIISIYYSFVIFKIGFIGGFLGFSSVGSFF